MQVKHPRRSGTGREREHAHLVALRGGALFLRRTIRVDRRLANVAGGSGFGKTKTRAGWRTIPVPRSVTDVLAAHLAEYPAGELGLIFTNETGGPPSRTSWSDHYRVACATAGVEGRTRTHDLRLLAESSLIASGLSVAAAQAVFGHAAPAETLDVYTHLWSSDEERALDAMSCMDLRASVRP